MLTAVLYIFIVYEQQQTYNYTNNFYFNTNAEVKYEVGKYLCIIYLFVYCRDNSPKFHLQLVVYSNILRNYFC